MVLPVKVLAGCGGLAGVSLVGCYLGGVFNDTPWMSLKEEGTSSYDSKIGKGYSIYLLAVHGDKDFNKSKWEELYKRYQSGKGESDEFAADQVNGSYSSKDKTNETKSLNKVCDSVYKKSETDVEFSKASGDEEKKHKLARDLLKYCSPLGKKPVTVKEHSDSYESGKIGGTDENKDSLVSTKDPANYYFWQAQEKWFEGETGAQNNGFFGTAFVDGANNKKVLKTNLKDKCEEAYKTTAATGGSSTKENPTVGDVKEYCSFKKLTN